MPKPKLPLPRVEVFEGRDHRYYFRKVNRNGRKTENPRQSYGRADSAIKAARRDVPGVPIVRV